jgi:protein-arginine kinase activator protein McsA
MSQFDPTQPQVDIANTTPVVCENCNNATFKDIMYVRKESRFTSGLPVDRMVPIQLIVCDKCGTFVEDFIPAPLKQFYGKSSEDIQSL